MASTTKDLDVAPKKRAPAKKTAAKAPAYYKPNKNKTSRVPDYYLYETDKWLVFPHELDGLTLEEIKENKPEIKDLLSKLKDYLS